MFQNQDGPKPKYGFGPLHPRRSIYFVNTSPDYRSFQNNWVPFALGLKFSGTSGSALEKTYQLPLLFQM